MKGLAPNLGLFAAIAERHYARRVSEQMLDLFQRERREHPDLSGRTLYEAVAARRLGDKPRMSAAELVRRLTGRGTEPPDVVARRLAVAKEELAAASEFDVTLVNTSIDEVCRQMVALINGNQ